MGANTYGNHFMHCAMLQVGHQWDTTQVLLWSRSTAGVSVKYLITNMSTEMLGSLLAEHASMLGSALLR